MSRHITTINRRLHELHWTEARLAAVSGVSAPMVNRIKNGHREPKVRTAVKLARALGTSVEALFAPTGLGAE